MTGSPSSSTPTFSPNSVGGFTGDDKKRLNTRKKEHRASLKTPDASKTFLTLKGHSLTHDQAINYGAMGVIGLVGVGLASSLAVRPSASHKSGVYTAAKVISGVGGLDTNSLGGFSIQDASSQLLTLLYSVVKVGAAFVTRQHIGETFGVEVLNRAANISLIKSIKGDESPLSVNRWVLNAWRRPKNVVSIKPGDGKGLFKRLSASWMNGPFRSLQERYGLNTPFEAMAFGVKQPIKPGELGYLQIKGQGIRESLKPLEQRIHLTLGTLTQLEPKYDKALNQFEVLSAQGPSPEVMRAYNELASHQLRLNDEIHPENHHEWIGRQSLGIMRELGMTQGFSEEAKALSKHLDKWPDSVENLRRHDSVDWPKTYVATATRAAEMNIQQLRHELKAGALKGLLYNALDQALDAGDGKIPKRSDDLAEIFKYFQEIIKYYQPENRFYDQYQIVNRKAGYSRWNADKAATDYLPIARTMMRSLYESTYPELRSTSMSRGKTSLDAVVNKVVSTSAIHEEKALEGISHPPRAITFNEASEGIARSLGVTPIQLDSGASRLTDGYPLSIRGHAAIIRNLRRDHPDKLLLSEVKHFLPGHERYRLPKRLENITPEAVERFKDTILDLAAQHYERQQRQPDTSKGRQKIKQIVSEFKGQTREQVSIYIDSIHEQYNHLANAPAQEVTLRYGDAVELAVKKYQQAKSAGSSKKIGFYLSEEFGKGRHLEDVPGLGKRLRGYLIDPLLDTWHLNTRMADKDQFEKNTSIIFGGQFVTQAAITSFVLGNVLFFVVYNTFARLDPDYRGKGRLDLQTLMQHVKARLGMGPPVKDASSSEEPFEARVKLSVNFEKRLGPFREQFDFLKHHKHVNGDFYQRVNKKVMPAPADALHIMDGVNA